MATWPTSLPGPMVGDLNLSRGATFIRTNMAAGPARQRRTSSQAPDKTDIRMSFTKLELAVFEAWYRHELDDGAAWFTLPLPAAGSVQAVQVRFISEQAPYAIKSSVDKAAVMRFEVTASIEIRDRPVMTSAQLAPYL